MTYFFVITEKNNPLCICRVVYKKKGVGGFCQTCLFFCWKAPTLKVYLFLLLALFLPKTPPWGNHLKTSIVFARRKTLPSSKDKWAWKGFGISEGFSSPTILAFSQQCYGSLSGTIRENHPRRHVLLLVTRFFSILFSSPRGKKCLRYEALPFCSCWGQSWNRICRNLTLITVSSEENKIMKLL